MLQFGGLMLIRKFMEMNIDNSNLVNNHGLCWYYTAIELSTRRERELEKGISNLPSSPINEGS